MSPDKLLHRIQLQIEELAPTLELFVDTNIQPSVQDCETLQKQLIILQENLAVYKYNKQTKELSPSFNIHARVSEKEKPAPVEEEKKAEIVTEIKQAIHLEKEEKIEVQREETELPKPQEEIPKPESEVIKPQIEIPKQEIELPKQETEAPIQKNEPLKSKPPISIGLNDKFRFMNDLFAQNSPEYNIAIEQINNLQNWNEGEIYLNSLKNVYGWQTNSEVVKYFYSLVKKRFD